MTAQQSPSPLALIAIISGGLGMLFTLMGCMFGPFMCLGTVFCLVGLILGFIEAQNVKSGSSAPANSGLAIAGAGLGGGGCALQALFGLCFAGFMALYVVLIMFAAIAGS